MSPAGLNVTIGLEQAGMELVLNLGLQDGSLATSARMSLTGAKALRDALNVAIDTAATTILKPPGAIQN